MIRRSRILGSRILAVVLVASSVVALCGSADAKVRHHRYRHRIVRAVPPLAPSDSPIPPRLDGYAAGVFETGIPGASSADPYEYQPALRRGYGYIAPRYDGPGFGYPGY